MLDTAANVLLVCSGVPAVIVGITSAASWDSYSSSHVCRLQGVAFYAALAGPIAGLFLFNFGVFITIIYTMTARPILTAPAQRKRFRFRTFAGLTILLGITWAFGLLLIGNHHIVIQWIFTLLVSTQGFSIFLFQVATHRLVRKRLSSIRQSLSTSHRLFSEDKSEVSVSSQAVVPVTWKPTNPVAQLRGQQPKKLSSASLWTNTSSSSSETGTQSPAMELPAVTDMSRPQRPTNLSIMLPTASSHSQEDQDQDIQYLPQNEQGDGEKQSAC